MAPTKSVSGSTKTKTIGGRTVPAAKSPRFYPTEDVRRPLASRKKPKPPALRKSITAGSVLILLAGRFQGKRVVCLGMLPSGLLLVTGPFKLNGVPLRRVNQAYVVATSTKINVAGVDVTKFDDVYFSKPASAPKEKSETKFFDKSKEKHQAPAVFSQ